MARPNHDATLAASSSLSSAGLLSAALAAFLSLSTAACTSETEPNGAGGDGSDTGTGGKGSGDKGSGGKGSGGSESEGSGGMGLGGDVNAILADRDGDGVTEDEGDCDDRNNRVFPGAEEESGDGVDSNCDGDELPALELVWGAGAPDNQVDALKLLDQDEDGAVSLAEFAAQCDKSAKLVGEARPGLVEVHASCAGTNSCKGMVYQSWNEIYEHSCRGLNGCSGWSCVELAADEKRDGAEAFEAAHCGFCHSPYENNEPVAGAFKVLYRPGQDPDEFVKEFWSSRSKEKLRSVVAFGVRGTTESGTAFSNMPGAYKILSLSEVDTLIDYVKTLDLEPHELDPLATPSPIE